MGPRQARYHYLELVQHEPTGECVVVSLHYHETRSGQPEATVVLSATTEPKGKPEAKHEVGEPNGNRHASGGTREGINIHTSPPTYPSHGRKPCARWAQILENCRAGGSGVPIPGTDTGKGIRMSTRNQYPVSVLHRTERMRYR